MDDLGTGDFGFVDSGVAGSNPASEDSPKGLVLFIERPSGATGTIGQWAGVSLRGITLPDRFLLAAVFDRPSPVPLTGVVASGTYAPSLLLFTGA